MARFCEYCGDKHNNRSVNICNECRFGICNHCGQFLDSLKQLPLCLKCWIEAQIPRGSCFL